MEWLNFKLMVSFPPPRGARGDPARCSNAARLLFLIQGEIPNRKAQPVVHEWCAVRFRGGTLAGILPLADFLKKTEFGSRACPNPGYEPKLIAAQQPAAGSHRRGAPLAFATPGRVRTADEAPAATELQKLDTPARPPAGAAGTRIP